MVVTVDDEAFVKKVYVEEWHMKLVSLNPNYEDIIVGIGKTVKVVGKVVF